MSGGGTVFHDAGNLNYCFITDKNAEHAAMDTDFLRPVVTVLSQLNIPAQVGVRKDLWLPDGYKISGTASHIARNRILFHGTLLYDAQLDVLHNALTVKEKKLQVKGIASLPSPVKNIKTYLSENGFKVEDKEIFFNQFVQSLAEYFHTKIEIISMEEMNEIQKIAANKYLQEEWIYRK
jgi:lipoate-protein ligase A